MQIDEHKGGVSESNEGTRKLLPGFKVGNIKIHLLSDDIERLYQK